MPAGYANAQAAAVTPLYQFEHQGVKCSRPTGGTWTCTAPNGVGGSAVVSAVPIETGTSTVTDPTLVGIVGQPPADLATGGWPNLALVEQLALTPTSVVGTNAVSWGTTGTLATGTGAIAIGANAQATGTNSIAVGTGTVVSASNAAAYGNNNTINAGATNSFVLGNNVTVNNPNNVVLGNNSADKAAVQVSSATVGAETYSGFAGTASGVVSMGAAGAERQVVHVAPGEISATSTDAVNGSQLYQVTKDLGTRLTENAKDANAGTAAAMAMAYLPQAFIPGKSLLAAGIGHFGGQTAIAIGGSRLSDNGRTIVKLSVTANTRGKFGVGLGAGIHW